ncbi:putative permease [Chrysochromulina ericina virus CeV-01B]|uniref:Permease n=1 Tax=Chrysochromulina ericina virus CeV-01B TaxID=3070830 RepID=A0A0N9Q9J2_9VIRU|nr:putative permease [Chrysochromulina ericina virus]ALH23229.1 putative permease [Chrysochromulina ericina virus CeV-01B]
MLEIILIIIAGFITGFFSGALGSGTSILLLPLLSFLTVIKNHKTAIGTTLFVSLPPLSIAAVYNYYKHDYVNIKIGMLLMVIITLSAWLGSYYSIKSDARNIAYITSSILLFLSIFWFYCGYTGNYLK